MTRPGKRIPPIRFVLLFPGRTGSTYLVTHMMSHPQICSRFEILSRHPDSWDDQFRCLRELFETRRFPVIKAVGFKTKISQVLDRAAFTKYLHDNQFRVIHQVRENKLKLIVSVVRAKMLRNAQGKSNLLNARQHPLGAIEIPEPIFARAKKRLNVARHLEEYIQALQLPVLKTRYEDLLTNEQYELGRVWDFLEVDRHSTCGITKKNTPEDIRLAVTNLNELLEKHPDLAPYIDQT